MHNYVNPLQIRKGDVLKVPVGRLQMYFRVVLVERDLCSNTFLRCFRVPPDADAIPANPYYALLWKDCSELVCLYQDYPSRGFWTTDAPMLACSGRFGRLGTFKSTDPASFGYAQFMKMVGEDRESGVGVIISRNGMRYATHALYLELAEAVSA